MLKLTDLRKTTRRASSGGRIVHPQFLRDRALAPRIELATRYMDSMVGRPRREWEQEVLVQLFGDHKLARCVGHALATHYRHRALTFAEALPPAQAAALTERGIATPGDLRLYVYRAANAQARGVIAREERAAFLTRTGAPFDLALEAIERLLALDLPANALLVRIGPVPEAADVIARCNFAIAATLVANATLIRLTLQQRSRQPDDLLDFARSLGVRAAIGGTDLTLHGQCDAFGNWSRHGANVVRFLSGLAAAGVVVKAGEAAIISPRGEDWQWRVSEEALAALGLDAASPTTTFAALARLPRLGTALRANLAAARRATEGEGWALRRVAEPLALGGKLVPALFTATRGTQRVYLVPAPATTEERAWLAERAAALPLVALAFDARDEGVPRLLAPANASANAAGGALDLAAALDAALHTADREQSRARWRETLREAGQRGVLTERDVAERLAVAEDDVPGELATPAARADMTRQGLRHIEGFGLCRTDVLARARDAADEVRQLRGAQPVGPAWTARVLGRRLREVTGTGEGIECLIAYLDAA
ncbi:MAG TPA: DUF790 family protein [Ktedonobacterales bacterium]|jgi:hypothetical protein